MEKTLITNLYRLLHVAVSLATMCTTLPDELVEEIERCLDRVRKHAN